VAGSWPLPKTCTSGTLPCGDGGPATSALLGADPLLGLAALSGSLYLADYGDLRIRAIDPTGDISNFAGDGTHCASATCGDGGPLSGVTFLHPAQLAAIGADLVNVDKGTYQRYLRRFGPGGAQFLAGGAGYSDPGFDTLVPGSFAEIDSAEAVAAAGASSVWLSVQVNGALAVRRVDF